MKNKVIEAPIFNQPANTSKIFNINAEEEIVKTERVKNKISNHKFPLFVSVSIIINGQLYKKTYYAGTKDLNPPNLKDFSVERGPVGWRRKSKSKILPVD